MFIFAVHLSAPRGYMFWRDEHLSARCRYFCAIARRVSAPLGYISTRAAHLSPPRGDFFRAHEHVSTPPMAAPFIGIIVKVRLRLNDRVEDVGERSIKPAFTNVAARQTDHFAAQRRECARRWVLSPGER